MKLVYEKRRESGMYNVDNIIQSIQDTWLPVFTFVGVLVLLFIIVTLIKKRRSEK